MKVHLIANPMSGGRRGAQIADALRAALAPRVGSIEVSVTQRAGDAEDLARESRADCIVSVGGDGTVNEVLNGLPDPAPILAPFPAGTANVIARELRIPKRMDRFVGLVATRATRTIDAGEANGRRFLLGIGAGLDAAIAKQVATQKTGLRGFARWLKPAVRSVLHFNHAPMRVRVDNEVVTESTTYAIVANCRFSAGVFPVTRLACVDDGRLDLCAMHRLSVPKLAWLAVAVFSPGFPKRNDVVYRQGREFLLEAASDLPVPYHLDGETAGFLPVRCTVLPNAVRIVAPPEN